MHRLIAVESPADVPPSYRGRAVERLVLWHNGIVPLGDPSPRAEVLVGMCMDNRKMLRLPENFAFVLRTGGANLRHNEFKVSFAIGVGGVREIALVVHNNCGMVNLSSRREEFVAGLVDAGWLREAAEQHFRAWAPQFDIASEIDFALEEARRMRERYPRVVVAPLRYDVGDNRLYFIAEE